MPNALVGMASLSKEIPQGPDGYWSCRGSHPDQIARSTRDLEGSGTRPLLSDGERSESSSAVCPPVSSLPSFHTNALGRIRRREVRCRWPKLMEARSSAREH